AEPQRVLVAREHDRAARARRREGRDRPVEEGEVLAEARLVRDPERRERPRELEPVRLERARDLVRAGAEVARRPELDPAVAELAHDREHPLRRDEVVAPRRALPHPPGAGRARQAQFARRASVHRATLRWGADRCRGSPPPPRSSPRSRRAAAAPPPPGPPRPPRAARWRSGSRRPSSTATPRRRAPCSPPPATARSRRSCG